MYQRLRENLIRTVGQEIPEEQLQKFCAYFFPKKTERKTILCEAGSVCKYLYFIEEGAAYTYYLNEKGEKVTVQLSVENYWMTDLYSFITAKSGIYNIETLEDCELLMFNRQHYKESLNTIPFVERYFRILTQNALIAQQYRITKTNSEDAEHRYLEFSQLYPHFTQRIPQYIIASYLGIQPQSLSRLRKKLNC